MRRDEFFEAADRLDKDTQIARVDRCSVEDVWNLTRRIPFEKTEENAFCLESFAGRNPDSSPDQRVALMLRCVLMHSLVEQGTLDDYLDNESSRKRVFVAVATLPCNKNDIGEAVAQKLLGECPLSVRENAKQEIRQAGYDPDHLAVGDKLIAWMRDHCPV